MLVKTKRTIKVIVNGETRLRPPLLLANGFGKFPPKPLPPNGLLLRLNPPPPKPELLMRRSYLLLGIAFTRWKGCILR